MSRYPALACEPVSRRRAVTVVLALLVMAMLLSWTDAARGAGASPYCPRPAELMKVSKRAALHYATAELGDAFTVRAAHHPRRGDFGWTSPGLPGGGFKTCARGVDRLTWYFDLHPPGMECHACDSHVYVVRYRNRKFDTLEFSG